jgi:hypothetical protein
VRCSHVVAIHLLVELGAELDVGDKDGLHPLNAPLPPALAPAPLLPATPSLPPPHSAHDIVSVPTRYPVYDIPCTTVCRGIPRGLVRQAALR